MIVIIIIGVILGFIIAFPISKILIKRHKRKITKDSVGKILKQKERDFGTLEGKPISLNFVNDGKAVDLKKQVEDELIKTKIKEIKGYEEEVKEIKKRKKKIKVSGSFKKKIAFIGKDPGKRKTKKKVKKHGENKRKN